MAVKVVAVNKSASFEYFIEEKFEAGIVLEGSEVKSIRKSNCNGQNNTADYHDSPHCRGALLALMPFWPYV